MKISKKLSNFYYSESYKINILSILFFLLTPTISFSQKQIAITFDDLPAALPKVSLSHTIDINNTLLAKLEDQHVPAIGFVNESVIDIFGEEDQRVGILKLWLDQGLDLGNHTYSHTDYNSTDIESFKKELLNGELYTKKLLKEQQKSIRYFRPPFLSTGNTVQSKGNLIQLLKENGYKIAPATIDNSDHVFSLIYLKAKTEGDTALMNAVGKKYLDFTREMLDYYENVTAKTIGKDIPQILLCHVNDLNADYMDSILNIYKDRGYKFISLDAALANPIYHQPDSYMGKEGLSWLLRWPSQNREEIINQKPKVTPAIYKEYKDAQAKQFKFLLIDRIIGFNKTILFYALCILTFAFIAIIILRNNIALRKAPK